jgi:4'-phosphopantetheinyl transferase
METLAKSAHQVCIYWLDQTTITDPALLDEYASWLNDHERQRWDRYKFAKDKHQHLVTRALLRFNLSRHHPQISPEQWQFKYNQHGKPDIANPLPQPLYFNLTHTANRAALAISHLGDIGLDVEHVRDLNQLHDLVERCFTDDEAQDILQGHWATPERRFFRYWTLKEAYIKGRGRGLSLPLQQFEFNACGQTPQIGFPDYEPEDTRLWQFKQWSLGAHHILALALAYPHSFDVQAFYSVPLYSHKEQCLAELA